MATIDLSAVTSFPWVYTAPAGTTWQGWTLPRGCGAVLVTSEGEAAYYALAGNGAPGSPEAPADGGAVGTHRGYAPSDTPIAITRDRLTAAATWALFTARAAGSGTLSLTLLSS